LLDFQQQDPTFDPDWAKKYLSQYLSSNSDILYCPVCNVQFSSLHNKQQHCLSRKHNEEVVTFVQKSVKMHQKKNGNIPASGNHTSSENHVKNTADHMNNITDYNVGPAVSHTTGTKDSIKDCVGNAVDHMNNTEDYMTHHLSIGEDHMSNAENHVSCTEDHVSCTKDRVNNAEDPMSSGRESTNAIICKDYISPTINNCNENNLRNNALTHTTTLVDNTDVNNSSTSVSNIGACEGHVITADSHICSAVDHKNNVLVREGTHDQPLLNFPPHYTLNHMIHDFTSHQQGE